MADGGGSRGQRAGANSPAAAPVSELLQQLRALGAGAANQGTRGGGSKTYAGLAAAAGRSPPQGQAGGGGSGSAVQEPLVGRHSGGGSYSREQRGTSAFFKRQGNADLASKVLQQQAQRRGTGTPAAAGSATPPSRPLARMSMSTPDSDSAASSFLEDDCLLFQMSGLRPVRTSSRTGAPSGGAFTQKQQEGTHRTQSAPAAQAAAAEAAGLSPPLSRAFSFADKPSPRPAAAPAPFAARQGPPAQAPAAAAAASPRGSTTSSRRRRCSASDSMDSETVAAVGLGRRASASGAAAPTRSAPPQAASHAPTAAATGCAGADGVYGEGGGTATAVEDGEDEEEGAEVPAAPPGWSEELLSWMLSEKAGLLVEAQRAQRREAELAAELDRLRARGGGAERDVQRLLAERRCLLDRLQQLSAAEAESNAAVERLCMENDALASDLERSQEVCREMLAARRAARDALADMSAQNARLLGAYVEKKQEAAHLQDALRRQQRQSEARIRVLEEQLRAAQVAANQGLPGSPHSPPSSPPPQPDPASPAGSVNTAKVQLLGSEDSEQFVAGPAGSSTGTPQRPGSSPLPNKENANVGGNSRQGYGGGGSSRGQQPKGSAKEHWDDERSELLTLLERLQDQLSTHAEQQQAAAAGAAGGRSATPQRKAAAGGGCAPPPSPFCQQPLHHGGAEHPAVPAPLSPQGSSDGECCQTGFGGRRGGGGTASNLQGSLESVSGGSSGGASEPTASPCHSPGYTTEGGSPAVMAHHHMAADSPTTERSARRSDAPSPPSVRQRWPSTAACPADEPTPCSAAPPAEERASAAKLPCPADQQARWAQQPQQAQRRSKTPTGSGQTMEAFMGPSPGRSGALPSAAAPPPAEQAERLQQAEQRAADLEAELEGLRQANAAAEVRAAREERRRAAEAAKVAGNAAFQAQRFEEAVQHYSAGLDSGAAREDAGLGAVLLCNRAAALHACGRFLDAVADCWRAEALDAGYARVFHRRADAYWALGAYGAAAEDLARLVRQGAGPDVAARLADAQRRCQAQQPVNHYAVLGVPPAATPGEIRSAYRQLALKFHPDKAGGAAAAGAGLGLGPDAADALFKLASEAHRVLADAEQRRRHDIAALRHKYRRFYNHAF